MKRPAKEPAKEKAPPAPKGVGALPLGRVIGNTRYGAESGYDQRRRTAYPNSYR